MKARVLVSREGAVVMAKVPVAPLSALILIIDCKPTPLCTETCNLSVFSVLYDFCTDSAPLFLPLRVGADHVPKCDFII